jgi:hypothetical protein
MLASRALAAEGKERATILMRFTMGEIGRERRSMSIWEGQEGG